MQQRSLMQLPLDAHGTRVRAHYPLYFDDGKVGEASSAYAPTIGVMGGRGEVAPGGRTDALVAGVAEVQCGKAVKAGDLLVAAATVNHLNRVVPRRDAGPGIGQKLATGKAASTDIAVAGLREDSEIVGVINLTDTSEVDLATVEIQAGGAKIQISSGTNNKKLLVTWRDEIRPIGIALEDGVAGDIIGALVVPQAF